MQCVPPCKTKALPKATFFKFCLRLLIWNSVSQASEREIDSSQIDIPLVLSLVGEDFVAAQEHLLRPGHLRR